MNFNKSLLTIIAIASFSFQAFAYDSSHMRHYKVTVTNLTKGISFTPLLSTSHNKHISLFTLGEMATDNIGRIAEGGDISGLRAMLDQSMYVSSTSASEGLLAPGSSVEISLSSARGFGRISLISMALPTNDTLVALRSKKLPKRIGNSRTYFMRAYDGGTETNDELCANIPGPHCGGVPFSPEDSGEGYIYPSPAIHGEADLSRAQYNWDGAVAKVTITRVAYPEH